MASSLKLVKFQQLARAKGIPDAQINSFIQSSMSQGQGNVMGAQQKQPAQQPQQTQTSTPQGNFVTRLIGAFVEPAKKYGGMVAGAGYEAYRADKTKKTGDDSIYLKQNPFLNEDEINTFSDPKKGIIEGAKRTAGAMSYAIPAGKSIKATAALAGTAGALDAVSREGATPESVATSAVTSMAIGGVLGAGAKVINAIKPQKVGQGLQDAGKGIKIQTYVKEMGNKPIQREGGNKLLNKMQEVGIIPGNAENILEQSKKIIQNNSGEIFKATQQLDQKGVKVLLKDIVGELQKQLKNSKSITTKKPIQEVIDTIVQDFGKKKTLTPSDLYMLKAEYGPLGSWNSLSSTLDKTKAEVWRDVYTKMNEVLDTTLKQNGFEEFRAINDAVHTAIQASQYAQRVGNIAPNRSTFGLMDMLAAGSGFAAGGGVPGAIGMGVAKKMLDSGKATNAIGDIVENTGKGFSNIPEANLPLGSAYTNAAIKTGVNQSTSGPVVPDQFGNVDNQSNSESNNELNNNDGHGLNTTNNENSIAQEFENMPKTAPSPMNPFGNLTKRQVMALALSNGANMAEVKEVGELYDIIGGDPMAISGETMKVAGDMRAEYFKLTQQNNFIDVSNQYNKISATSDSPAGDISLIFSYMKMLDPGSTVREGEFDNVQSAASYIERVYGKSLQIGRGNRLTENQRADLKDEAGTIFQQYQNKQQQIDELYFGLAQRYGLDPSLVGIGSIK